MPAFYPPVLASKANAIPGVVKEQADGYYLDIEFPMPTINVLGDIGHIQVSIKNQATNEPAVNPNHSPDRAIIYIKRVEGTPYFMKKSNGNYLIRVPYKCFAGGAPQQGVTYTIQVRFGVTPTLWDPASNGIDGLGEVGAFAMWRNTQVNAVPSGFGEWSNVMTVYCYGPATEELTYNLDDFVPELIYSYVPEGNLNDPLEQVKIVYNYADMYGSTFNTMVFNGTYQQDGSYSVKAKLPIAPVQQINVSVEAITKNNTIRGKTLQIMPLKFSKDLPVIGGKMWDTFLRQEEIEDGVIAKTFSVNNSPDIKPGDTYSVYRSELYTLKTVKIVADQKLSTADEYTFKDFTVEMGEDYQYIVVLKHPDPNPDDDPTINYQKSYALVIPIYEWGYENQGYGRLTKMESTFLTTKNHQLRLTGNVSVSSLKRNTNDAFQTTIGSQYPFYSRNSKMNYRTFTLNGVVSILFDPTATFLRNDYKNGLWWDNQNESKLVIFNRDLYSREQVSPNRRRMWSEDQSNYKYIHQLGKEEYQDDPSFNKYPKAERNNRMGEITEFDQYLHRDITRIATTEKSDEMIFLERKFRECVMEWLSDGKPKLFRSETEGNMIVMLSGVGFSPLDKTARMVYSVSMTVTEIAEASMENLILYNLVPVEITSHIIAGFPRDLVLGDKISEEDYLTIVGIDHTLDYTYVDPNPPSGGQIKAFQPYLNEWMVVGRVDDINKVVRSITEYTFTRGDVDPYLIKKLIYQYNPVYDIPNLIANEEMKPINTRPAVLNASDSENLTFSVLPGDGFGSLPSGLSIDNRGIISGTPKNDTGASTEPYLVQLQVRDDKGGKGDAETATMVIKVGQIYTELMLTYNEDEKTIPGGVVGIPIPEIDLGQFASGGLKFTEVPELEADYDYVWYAEGLPSGLSINNKGIISGSYLNAVQTGEGKIIVMDAAGQTKIKKIYYGTATKPLTFMDSSDFDIYYTEVGVEMDPVDVSSGVSGGILPEPGTASEYIHGYIFSQEGLPPGLDIDPKTGIISGAPTEKRNAGSAKIYAKDFGNPATTVSINIVYQEVLDPLKFEDKTRLDIVTQDGKPMPLGTVIAPIEVQLEGDECVTGGLKYSDKPYYRFSAEGLLPDFTIDNFGKITGRASVATPEEEVGGNPRTATLIVTDARGKSASVKIEIADISAKLQFKPSKEYSLPATWVGNDSKDYQIVIPMTDVSHGQPPYAFALGEGWPGDEMVVVTEDTDGDKMPDQIVIKGIPNKVQQSRKATLIITDSSTQKDTIYFDIPVGAVVDKLEWDPKNLKNIVTQEDRLFDVDISTVIGGMPPYTLKCTNPYEMIPCLEIKQSEGGEQEAWKIRISGTMTKEWAGVGRRLNFALTDALGQERTFSAQFNEPQGAFQLSLMNSLEKEIIIVNKSHINAMPIMKASGGDETFTYHYLDQLNTTLIPGITLNTTDGTISGTPTSIQNASKEVHSDLFAFNKDKAEMIFSEDLWYLPRVLPGLSYAPGIGDTLHIPEHAIGAQMSEIAIFENPNIPGQVWEVEGTLPPGISFENGRLKGTFTLENDGEKVICWLKVPRRETQYIITDELSLKCTVTFDGAHGGFVWLPNDLIIKGGEVGSFITEKVISEGLSGGKPPFIWKIDTSAPSWLQLKVEEQGRKVTLYGKPDSEVKESKDIPITVTDNLGNSITNIFRLQPILNPLNFKFDARMNIPAKEANQDIPSFDIIANNLVTGGSGNFEFFADENIFPYEITINGTIRGNSKSASYPERKSVITVRDTITGIEKTQTITVGKINGEMSYVHDPSRDIPTGKVNTSGTINFMKGVIGGAKAEFSIVLPPQDSGWTGTNLKINAQTGILTYTRPSVAVPATKFLLTVRDTVGPGNTTTEIAIGEVTA